MVAVFAAKQPANKYCYHHGTALFAYFQAQNTLENAKK
jgi:hypothetical protein